MNDKIVWEDPPDSPVGQRGRWKATADQLKQRPGEWAKIAAGVNAVLADSIKGARSKTWAPAGAFEAVIRNPRFVEGHKSQVVDVYARYIGNSEKE